MSGHRAVSGRRNECLPSDPAWLEILEIWKEQCEASAKAPASTNLWGAFELTCDTGWDTGDTVTSPAASCPKYHRCLAELWGETRGSWSPQLETRRSDAFSEPPPPVHGKLSISGRADQGWTSHVNRSAARGIAILLDQVMLGDLHEPYPQLQGLLSQHLAHENWGSNFFVRCPTQARSIQEQSNWDDPGNLRTNEVTRSTHICNWNIQISSPSSSLQSHQTRLQWACSAPLCP